MHNSHPYRDHDVREQVMTSTTRNNLQELAPEVRAARRLLEPDVQQQIAQLADGIEATLHGNQPARPTPKRGRHRGISLWIGIPLAGLVSVAIVSSAGWAGAVRYHSIAEKNILIAQQQGELAAAERSRREEIEAWQERVGRVMLAQLEVVAGLLETGRYDRALALLDTSSEIATAVEGRDGELATRLRQQRMETIMSLIAETYTSNVDLSSVRSALQQLTDSEIAGQDAPDSTSND